MNIQATFVSMATAFVATFGAMPATAADQTGESAWSGNFGIGAEYDSNVAVLELDETTGDGDYAGLIDLGLAYEPDLGDNADFKIGYDFSQSLHDEFDEFDLRLHRGSVELGYDLGIFKAGVMGHYAHAALDGDEFLTLKRVSPYLSRLFGEVLFLRGAYVDTDKEYEDNPGRDADKRSYSADAFVFLNGLTTYLVFGYDRSDEDAVAAEFDYDGRKYSTQFVQRIGAGKRPLVFKARLRYEERDYTEPTPSIGEERLDERYQAKLSLDIPLSEHLTAQTAYHYADNRSNLPEVDFQEHVGSLMLSVGF